jgi:hypothetical protein
MQHLDQGVVVYVGLLSGVKSVKSGSDRRCQVHKVTRQKFVCAVVQRLLGSGTEAVQVRTLECFVHMC